MARAAKSKRTTKKKSARKTTKTGRSELARKKKITDLLAKLNAAGAHVKRPSGTKITSAIARDMARQPVDFEAWVTWTLRF